VASGQGDYERAAVLFEEGLLLSRDIGARHILAEALEGLTWVAAARGQWRRAARLGAAAQAERDVLGQPVPSTDREHHDRAVQATRATLGEGTFAEGWAGGLAMTLDEAITLALGAGPAG
jgi:non-specific serine/threonine protein kinase